MFVETNFTSKKYDKFKKKTLDKSNLFIRHYHVHE